MPNTHRLFVCTLTTLALVGCFAFGEVEESPPDMSGEPDNANPNNIALPACEEADATCSGDILGSWRLEDACLSVGGAMLCGSELDDASIEAGGGELTFEEDGTLLGQIVVEWTIGFSVARSEVPASCGGAAATCKSIERRIPLLNRLGWRCKSDRSDLECECSLDGTPQTVNFVGYEVAGDELYLGFEDPDGLFEDLTWSYCVKNDLLVVQTGESALDADLTLMFTRNAP